MNTLVPDDYDIEVWVTMNDGTQAIFPSDGTLGFSIEENLMSDTGEVIPTITLNDFQQQFNDLSSQMENAIHNVQKGDKGDKGDTGQGLEIKDRVSSVSNLPSTANEGDGYLVNEELYIWVNGAWKDCGPIQGPQGIQGIQGKTGTGVSSTTIQYQISNSATTAPTGTWSNTLIATTQDNPFLWMQATLNYDDGTSKSFYLVSSKGDKGDKGDTGPVGPQGPVGAGLIVKGTVSNASQLPTTGNQEGYCYFVGTDLYIWDAGAWKNCGSVSPDLSNYVTVTDLNNGLSTKVTDNKDNTIQVNGTQVNPYNKSTDTIGGRNYLINTNSPGLNEQSVRIAGASYPYIYSGNPSFQGQSITVASTSSGETYWRFNIPQSTVSTLPAGTYTLSGYLSSYDNMVVIPRTSFYADGKNWQEMTYPSWQLSSTEQKLSYTFTIPSNATGWYTSFEMYKDVNSDLDNTGKSFTFRKAKLELGDIATDWTTAPEDKVNVADMRKPASDVAGIEEVNAKQDKLTITPADDSKVVHTADMRKPANDVAGIEEVNAKADDSKVAHLSGANNFDTTPTVNNNPLLLASSLPSDLARTSQLANFTDGLQKSGKDVATTTDVTNAVNSATSNSSKYIEASKNDEASAISDSQASNSGNIYYWTED